MTPTIPASWNPHPTGVGLPFLNCGMDRSDQWFRSPVDPTGEYPFAWVHCYYRRGRHALTAVAALDPQRIQTIVAEDASPELTHFWGRMPLASALDWLLPWARRLPNPYLAPVLYQSRPLPTAEAT